MPPGIAVVFGSLLCLTENSLFRRAGLDGTDVGADTSGLRETTRQGRDGH